MKKNKYKCSKGIKKIKKAEDGLQINGDLATGASALGSTLIEGATASKYDSKYTSQLKDENQATGRAIGAATGMALNAAVPGLGVIAAPLLSTAGGAIQRGFQNKKLEEFKKTDEYNQRVAKNNEGLGTDLTSFQAKQYKEGGTVKPYKAKTKEEFESRSKAYSDSLSLYNGTQNQLKGVKVHGYTKATDKVNTEVPVKGKKNTYKTVQKPLKDFVKKYKEPIAPIGQYEVGQSYKANSNSRVVDGAESSNISYRNTVFNYKKPVQEVLPPDSTVVSPQSFEAKKDTISDSSKGQYIQEVKSSDSRLANDKGYTKYKVKAKVKPANATYSKGTKVIEIEGKKTPEIHTDKNFNVKNLGTVPHSKGGNKVVAEEGDIVFPTQNSPKKYNEIMNAIMKKDKYKLKKEQAKLPEDKASKYPDGNKRVKAPEPTMNFQPYADFFSGINTALTNTFGSFGNSYSKGIGTESATPYEGTKLTTANPVWKAPMAVPRYSPLKETVNNAGGYISTKDGKAAPAKSKSKSKGKGTSGRPVVDESKFKFKPSTSTTDELPDPIVDSQQVAARANIDQQLGDKYAKIDVPTAQKTETVLSGGKTPESTSSKFKFDANKAMELAPIAYNLGQGLFGKTEKVNRREYNPELEKYVDTSSNMRREVNSAYKTATSNARNLSGGLGSNFRANAQVASNAKLAQMNQIDSQEYGKQLDVNNRNTQTTNNAKLTNLQLNNQYDELDAMNRAKKSEALSQGLTELGQLGSRNILQKNALQATLINADAVKRSNYGANPTTDGTNITSWNQGFLGGEGEDSGTQARKQVEITNNSFGNLFPTLGVGRRNRVSKQSKGSKSIQVERKYKLK